MGKWGGGSEDALKEKNREGAHMKIRAPHLVSMASSSRYQAPEKDRKFTSKCSKAQGLVVRPFCLSLRSGLPVWHLTHKESSVHVCLNK